MNFHQLKIFYTVAQRQSITAAAFDLRLTQPAVSQQVTKQQIDTAKAVVGTCRRAGRLEGQAGCGDLSRRRAECHTAAAILIGLGFTQVSNLKGGMLDWKDRDYPIDP